MKVVDITGIPLDLGAGRRGVDMGRPPPHRESPVSIASLGYVVNDHGNVPVPIPETIGLEDRQRGMHERSASCAALFSKE